ncbi:MAG: hybrid sensor histidine kinase/response regulator [Kiritimatiellia bacterium]
MTSANYKRIFIVDDHPENLELLENILRDAGYRTACFPSGDLALAAAAKKSPDLILLDVMIPDEDGYEVCQRLKLNPSLRDCPVIFISALNETSHKIKAFGSGGVDYITKPYVEEEILARVATHMQLRERQAELEKAYQRLQQLEDFRKDLTQMIVHDLRSPLSGIMMGLELLQLEMVVSDSPASTKLLIKQTIKACNSMKLLVSTILDMSHLQDNKLPITFGIYGSKSLFEETLSSLLYMDEVKVPSHSVSVYCDKALTVRVLQNLLGNALTHAGGSGVELRVEDLPEEVRMEVADSGPGIPLDKQKCIFNKFSQLNSKAKLKDGSGLGLAYCKLAVESQGGKIGVHSSPGEGSVFWFTLPKKKISLKTDAPMCCGVSCCK